jgi:hypothetical protein
VALACEEETVSASDVIARLRELLTRDELKVLRRLSRGATSAVNRIDANRLQDRGLVGRVPMVGMTYCITEAGRAALDALAGGGE